MVLPLVGVDDDGAGPLVDEGDLHIGTEFPVLDFLEALLVHLGEEQLIGIHREGRFGRLDEAGAVALAGVAVEGELADHQRRVPEVPGAEVEFIVFVLENAQARAFIGQLGHDVEGIGILHPQQDDKAGADGPRLAAVDPDRGGGYRLNDCTHGLLPLFVSFWSP